MSYRIKLRREALAELKRLPAYVRAEAVQKIESLKADPRPLRSKELRGKSDVFRLWVAGNWRLVYGVDDAGERVWVLRARHKDSIDYESVTWEVHEPEGPKYVSRLEDRVTIPEDFRLRIPVEIRRQLSLQPGQQIRIMLDHGVITLIPSADGPEAITEQYRRAYAGGDALGEEFEGWEDQGEWPPK